MQKWFVFILSIFMFPMMAFSQTIIPKIVWSKIYDGPGHSNDLPNDFKMDHSNNLYLAGRSAGLNNAQDLLILKYSNLGDSLLALQYMSAQSSWDEAFSLAIDSDLNIYVVGWATFDQNTFYAIFHKYAATGELIWAKDFYDNANITSEGVQVVLNSNEDAIIGYNQRGGVTFENTAKIAKYSSSGDSLWTVSVWDDTSSYQVDYLITDTDDNIYAAFLQAYWDGGDLPATKIIFMKINDLGEILWKKNVDSYSGTRKIIFDRKGNLLLLSGDTEIKKFTPQGDSLWTKSYPHLGDIVITTDLGVDSNNDIVFTGYGIGNDSWDYFTQKISSAGEDLWTKVFNSDEQLNDFAQSLALDAEDNIYVTGGTHNSTSEGVCYTLRYSSDGELKWKFRFDSPSSFHV